MTTSGSQSTAERLFYSITDLPEDERAAALDAGCGTDAVLRARVLRLLRADEAAPPTFLAGEERPASEPAPTGAFEGFTILERLGEGGMGTVYAARQAAPERDVAIKVVRRERFSAESAQRFRFEIQVLGQLEHPGIARIYQSGTVLETGLGGERLELPYFVMELVRGRPLIEFARARELSVRERLTLFIQVCEAVDHAHQRGFIHRDLKSENVLVTDEQTAGRAIDRAELARPKILDFGIARTLESSLEDAESTPALTRTGDFLGTPGSMSPEQAHGWRGSIDARADVYSLGVILYELLGGRPPLDLTNVPIHEALRRIREDEPRALSELDPALRGDLSVITRKALEKTPDHRYRTAWNLAEELRRHLSGAPIEARQSSTWYVLRRELQLHKKTVAVVALVFGLLLAFALFASHQARQNKSLAEAAQAALIRTNIESGRLLGRAGNPAGEGILWRSLFSAPTSQQALYALAEYYADHPVDRSWFPGGEELQSLLHSPELDALLTAGDDGILRLLDPETLHTREEIDLGSSTVTYMALAPDRSILAAATTTGEVHLVDLESRRTRNVLLGHETWVSSVAFVPGGKELVTTCRDGRIWLWDLETGQNTAELARFSGRGLFALFSPDGTDLVATGGDELLLWEDFPSTPPRSFPAVEEVVHAAYSPDGATLWAGGTAGILHRWHLESGEHRAFPLNNGTVRRLLPSSDGARLHVLGWWRVETLDTETGEALSSIPLPGFSWGLVISPDEERMYVTDNSGLVRRWSLAGSSHDTVPSEAGQIELALARDGTELWVERAGGALHVIDLEDAARERVVEESGADVNGIALSPDGRHAIWNRVDGKGSQLFDLEANRPVQVLPHPGEYTRQRFEFSPSGRRLALAGRDGRVHLFEVAGETDPLVTARIFDHGASNAVSVGFSPDERTLAVTDRRSANIALLDTETGALLTLLDVPGDRPWTVSWSRDGHHLVAGTWERVLQVWNTRTYELEARIEGHRGAIWDVAFLPESDVLASCSADQTVRLWNPIEGINLATFDLRDELDPHILSVADRNRVAVGGTGPGAVVLNLDRYLRAVAGNLDAAWKRFGSESASPEALESIRRLLP